jgi:hypothetical protein
MEIKHQVDRPSLPGILESAETIIRHNVWSKQNRASTGGDARPNLIVGHFPTSGPAMGDRYVIYGNFFHENPSGESLFQGEGNVLLYSNVFFTTGGAAIAIQPHNDVPRDIWVFFNTIVASGRGLRITGADTAFAQSVVGNAVFADGIPIEGGMAVRRANVTGSVADAAMHLLAPAAPLGALDLHPIAGRLTGPTPDLLPTPFVAGDRDFDLRSRRDYSDRGAYAGPSDASSWVLARERKP